MSKFYGEIGFIETKETVPGVWTEEVVSRNYYGDVIRNTRRWQPADKVNDDLNINNQFSIVADPYAVENFHAMKYIEWMNSKWKISSIEVQYPRLILEVSGIYTENGG